MDFRNLKKFVLFDTAGWIAISGFLICVLTGIWLAISYNINNPYRSVSEILLFNPAGKFIRNLHYWSAQLFFIFTLLHIYDHFNKNTETNIRTRRTWLILCTTVFVLGYEMLTGFILKADASGIQARRIIASILDSIPLGGEFLKSFLFGVDENLQIVYIQHISTGTIILFIAVYDHIRTIWPKLKSFLIVFFMLILTSFFFRASLGQENSSMVKGPWFFVGIQEILHYSSYPGIIILFFILLFAILFFLPEIKVNYRRILKKILLSGSLLYLTITVIILFFRGENWEWQGWNAGIKTAGESLLPDPVKLFANYDTILIAQNQKAEGCLICHGPMKGLTVSHNPSVIGCYSCHRGDPFSMEKATAHSRMIKFPGNLSNVSQTCGTQNCHADISLRIMNSLMTSQNGIIAIDKFVFNETSSLNDTFHIRDLGKSPADTHLRNLCAGCHLGKEKTSPGNAGWLQRGGGCNACHLHYNNKATLTMKRMQSETTIQADDEHPSIDIRVPNERCLSCHSRSGRISLGYEGWNETTINPEDISDSVHYRILPDERVLEFIQADIHHQKEIACIDCHTSYEIMGDGNYYTHKEDAVHVQCIDCHPVGKVNSVKVSDIPDYESQMIASLRNYNKSNRIVVTLNSGRLLLNSNIDSSGAIFLTEKLTGKEHLSKPAGKNCNRGTGHNRLSCESCHMAWTPQCIGCHNSFENNTQGFDLLEDKQVKGTWVEYAGKIMAEPPVLGISNKNGEKVIGAIPGMILSVDLMSAGMKTGNIFRRLYAPASGHTIMREGRSCKSCHNNPLAIGFGRGNLNYKVTAGKGIWTFDPRFKLNEYDNLPEDAWVGFLKEAEKPFSTRTHLRPFSVAEQKRILEVGACLTCHEENSNVMDDALNNYQETTSHRSKKCILPN